MAEYRLEELATESGVSARNIRAYRERGLLDPPRRVGRSAIYDDAHLAQLKMISELLGRGFTSTHIAEFFARMREGHDIADILGMQRVILNPRREGHSPDGEVPSLDLDPASDDARRLVELGLAEEVDGSLVLLDARLAEVVASATDQKLYVRSILRIHETTTTAVDDLAHRVVNALRDHLITRFGANFIPKPTDMTELRGNLQAYHDLAITLTTLNLDQALERRMLATISDYTAGIMLGRGWDAGTT